MRESTPSPALNGIFCFSKVCGGYEETCFRMWFGALRRASSQQELAGGELRKIGPAAPGQSTVAN